MSRVLRPGSLSGNIPVTPVGFTTVPYFTYPTLGSLDEFSGDDHLPSHRVWVQTPRNLLSSTGRTTPTLDTRGRQDVLDLGLGNEKVKSVNPVATLSPSPPDVTSSRVCYGSKEERTRTGDPPTPSTGWDFHGSFDPLCRVGRSWFPGRG